MCQDDCEGCFECGKRCPVCDEWGEECQCTVWLCTVCDGAWEPEEDYSEYICHCNGEGNHCLRLSRPEYNRDWAETGDELQPARAV